MRPVKTYSPYVRLMLTQDYSSYIVEMLNPDGHFVPVREFEDVEDYAYTHADRFAQDLQRKVDEVLAESAE